MGQHAEHDWKNRTNRVQDGMICKHCDKKWLPSEYMPKGPCSPKVNR